MANNRKTTRGRNNISATHVQRTQVVYSEPQKLFKEEYLTPKGQALLRSNVISKDEAWSKYGKKRYVNNPNAIAIRIVTHPALD